MIFDLNYPNINGIISATQKGTSGFYATLIVYYLWYLPFELFLAFYMDWKVFGLWFAFFTSISTLLFVNVFILYRMDWDKQVSIIIT